ncbi:hypothetical protein QBC35DRAFT_258414 [Podospora australis]|uniref:Uncharacterized protein n=1 Tax=Podospora australis TaxID=1536484 RepID=A0AAN7AKE1_9PEZI|nr:hypothetical protein QBC35DRAFT_258414 [Podospora australis]
MSVKYKNYVTRLQLVHVLRNPSPLSIHAHSSNTLHHNSYRMGGDGGLYNIRHALHRGGLNTIFMLWFLSVEFHMNIQSRWQILQERNRKKKLGLTLAGDGASPCAMPLSPAVPRLLRHPVFGDAASRLHSLVSGRRKSKGLRSGRCGGMRQRKRGTGSCQICDGFDWQQPKFGLGVKSNCLENRRAQLWMATAFMYVSPIVCHCPASTFDHVCRRGLRVWMRDGDLLLQSFMMRSRCLDAGVRFKIGGQRTSFQTCGSSILRRGGTN